MKTTQLPLISGEKIKDYIPQREPIIMVDAFYGIENGKSFSGLTVAEDNIFVENGCLNEAGIVEHIAQSCALRVGYECRKKNEPVPVGYIGALKNIIINVLPTIGQKLVTEVAVVQEIFDCSLVAVNVKTGEKSLASGEMKIFLMKNA
ncbi:MAG: hydroxymyristoyl-ACP dehydratase [Dysgonamonadaceae bacterium]|jgi:predicted hotdog family 3-hydroxylacyl-ACP dehydratase|nr:hydroxymyristoyl-ACP dehydratase [Dysgonamonadaceae bacterium]